jgi:hypothetical protein
MSDKLRWILILGCAVVAVLHAPTAAGLIAESWHGPYANPGASGGRDRATALAPDELLPAAPVLEAHHGDGAADAQLERELATWRGGIAQGL